MTQEIFPIILPPSSLQEFSSVFFYAKTSADTESDRSFYGITDRGALETEQGHAFFRFFFRPYGHLFRPAWGVSGSEIESDASERTL